MKRFRLFPLEKLSIRFRTFLFLSSLVILFVFLGYSTLQSYFNTLDITLDNLHYVNSNNLHQLSKKFESNMLQLKRITESISKNKVIIDCIKEYEDNIDANKLQLNEKIKSILLKSQNFNRYITSIIVLTDRSAFFCGNVYSSKTLDVNLSEHKIMNYLRQTDDDTSILMRPETPDMQDFYYMFNLNANSYIMGGIIDNQMLKTGMVLVVLDLNMFDDLFYQQENLVLLDEKAEPVWKGSDTSSIDFNTLKNQPYYKVDNSSKEISEGKYYTIYNIKLEFNNWKFIYVYKNSEIFKIIYPLRTYFLIIFAVTISISLLFSRLLSKKISKPLDTFSNSLNSYEIKGKQADTNSNIIKYNKFYLREIIMYFIILITIVPTVLLNGISYIYSNNIMRKYLVEKSSITFAQISENVDSFFDRKKNVFLSIAYDDGIQRILDMPESVSETDHRDSNDIADQYILMHGYEKNDFFIYNTDNNIIFSNNYNSANTIINGNMPDNFKNSADVFTWIEPERDNYNRLMIYFICKVNQISTYRFLGYFQSQIPEFELENEYRTLYNESLNIYIVNKEGVVMSNQDKSRIGSTLDSAYEVLQDSNIRIINNTFVFRKKISNSPWYIIGYYDFSNIDKEIKRVFDQKIYTIIIMFLVIIFVSYILSQSITSPVSKLNNLLSKFGIDNVDLILLNRSPIYEINSLYKSFNRMVIRSENLVDQLILSTKKQKDTEMKKRTAELVALQSQINPHFLYNTFESINSFVKRDDKQNTLKMINSLSDLLRYSVKSPEILVPISEELEYVNYYIKIMKMRFKNKISFTFDLEKETLQCMTIKLILQPIIENSIYHAIIPKQGIGSISIGCLHDSKDIIINISDDGVGIDEVALENLNRQLHDENFPEKIGLFNVQNRIRLSFGEKYGLTIYSLINKGTTVKIRIPKIEHKSD